MCENFYWNPIEKKNIRATVWHFREHKNVQLSSSKAMLHSCSKPWASNTLKFETILSFGELMAKMDADKL